MLHTNSEKNYLIVNKLITKGMLKRRRLSNLAISKITESTMKLKVIK